MNDLHLSLSDLDKAAPTKGHMPIGRHLVNDGLIAQRDLMHALDLQTHIDAPLGDIMVSEGLVCRKDVLVALARQSRAEGVDLDDDPPASGMAKLLPVALCLRYKVVPWKVEGRTLFVATSNPAEFAQLRRAAGPGSHILFPVIVDEMQIQTQLGHLYGQELAHKAMVRVPAAESCRNWATTNRARTNVAIAALLGLALAFAAAPYWTITLAMFLATLTLLMTTTLKAAAFLSHLAHRAPERPANFSFTATKFRMPRVSMLVPLLKEKEIAEQLIARLSRLTYPKSLLNIVLVLEEGDSVTRDTIARTSLPEWMSVIEVPEAGQLTTKPRALNYALDFCRGSIVGVWDAEDWPEPDQIERVVTRFADAPANVACLQGVLDYYNSRTNWLTRCFTIEYATWWRVILPGIARLGLVVPLGGTTLFFRRDILEKIAGWDAHNVTEDADLGVRLARHGYVTELLPTVTHEEATSRPWPWIRQRSRWLKGFLITYCVHMRHPRQLLRELGPKRFMGLQAIFLATFSQFAFAPLLWSYWITLLGHMHPVEMTLGSSVAIGMASLFLAAEILNMSMALTAVSGPKHRHLLVFVPTMMIYFTLGTIAAYKALWEILRAPFFWDKTSHGVSHQTDQT